jgi:hypothetical protein
MSGNDNFPQGQYPHCHFPPMSEIQGPPPPLFSLLHEHHDPHILNSRAIDSGRELNPALASRQAPSPCAHFMLRPVWPRTPWPGPRPRPWSCPWPGPWARTGRLRRPHTTTSPGQLGQTPGGIGHIEVPHSSLQRLGHALLLAECASSLGQAGEFVVLLDCRSA